MGNVAKREEFRVHGWWRLNGKMRWWGRGGDVGNSVKAGEGRTVERWVEG